jgi:hypothetical protein
MLTGFKVELHSVAWQRKKTPSFCLCHTVLYTLIFYGTGLLQPWTPSKYAVFCSFTLSDNIRRTHKQSFAIWNCSDAHCNYHMLAARSQKSETGDNSNTRIISATDLIVSWLTTTKAIHKRLYESIQSVTAQKRGRTLGELTCFKT